MSRMWRVQRRAFADEEFLARGRCSNNLPDETGHPPFMTCVVAIRPTEFNAHVLSLEIADLSQA